MTRTGGYCCAIAIAVIAFERPALTAGIKETTRLIIDGPALQGTIEITDPAVLALSHVYQGAFIGERAADPDPAWPRFHVTFDIQALEGVRLAAYVVHYTTNPATGEGFIREGVADRQRNAGTIFRTFRDTGWHHASAAWSSALNARLR
jgi:hypothetical protein